MLSWDAEVRADTAEYPPDVGGSFWAATTYTQFRDRAIDILDRAGCRVTMAESSSSAINRTLDTIGKRKGPANYREWGKNVRQAFSLNAREMLKVLVGAPRPEETNADGVAAWETANNIYSILFLSLIHI